MADGDLEDAALLGFGAGGGGEHRAGGGTVKPEAMANDMKSRRDSLPRPTAFWAAFIFISNSVMRFLLGDQ